MVKAQGAAVHDSVAEKHFKKGKKAISTGIFKWSADYVEGSIEFEKAAKRFAMSGLEARAMEAWLAYADACEKNNEMSAAGEGLQEAAFCTNDADMSMQLLERADQFYIIGGYNDRGLTLIKRFAKQLIDKETDESKRKAMEIYEQTLMVKVFENENVYLLNSDVPVDYLRLQVNAKDYAGAIKTKKRFIDFLRGIGTTDHQIRRSWLEIICLQILMEDFYRLEDSLQSFANEPGHRNIFMQDEFLAAGEIKDAVSAKDFAKLVQALRKPIFGFIEIEVVKPLKRWAANPPANVVAMAPLTDGGISSAGAAATGEENPAPMTKDEALDNMLL